MKKAKNAKVAMTREEARAAAEAEGLVLVSTNKGTTGYKGVLLNPSPKNPFKAVPCIHGNACYLGSFATAEEASLAIARLHATVDRM